MQSPGLSPVWSVHWDLSDFGIDAPPQPRLVNWGNDDQSESDTDVISGNHGDYFLEQNIERWKIGEKTIDLLRKKNQLSYKLFDNATGNTITGFVKLDGHPIDDVITYLVEKCQPEFTESGEIHFSLKPSLPYIQRWIIDDNEICVYRKEGKLTYELLNNKTGKLTEGEVKYKPGDIDETNSSPLNIQPAVSEDGLILFSPKPLVCHTWRIRNKEIQLLQSDNNLIWQLFDKSTNTGNYSGHPICSANVTTCI